jgi:excisionase family DNA binding protein
MEGYITVKQYAKKENVSLQNVYTKIMRGTIEYVKIGNTYLIKNK